MRIENSEELQYLIASKYYSIDPNLAEKQYQKALECEKRFYILIIHNSVIEYASKRLQDELK